MPNPRPAIDFDYKRYLASREWSVLREQVRERSGDRCEHCWVAPQQAVHHLTYERIGREEIEDLMAVCNPCHEFLSGKSDDNPLFSWCVMSPAFEDPVRGGRYHLAIPFTVEPLQALRPGTDAARVTYRDCQPGCIWCGYVDRNWLMFVRGLYYTEVFR